ncbi:hypothetical protein FG877_16675 [Enterococcus casseliflavus]|nr:hypothetical protein [Enterococcus casseliflavus]
MGLKKEWRKMKMRFALLFLCLFIGVGACGGSLLAFKSIEPLSQGQTYAGLEAAMLQGTPFTTFLIPGSFLLIILGLGNLIVAILLWLNKGYYGAMLLGMSLVAWIIVQVILLRGWHVLHLIFFLIGLFQFASAVYFVRSMHLPLPFSAHQN